MNNFSSITGKMKKYRIYLMALLLGGLTGILGMEFTSGAWYTLVWLAWIMLISLFGFFLLDEKVA